MVKAWAACISFNPSSSLLGGLLSPIRPRYRERGKSIEFIMVELVELIELPSNGVTLREFRLVCQ
jgi:hypothetical protein